jgi:hypothetical protein
VLGGRRITGEEEEAGEGVRVNSHSFLVMFDGLVSVSTTREGAFCLCLVMFVLITNRNRCTSSVMITRNAIFSKRLKTKYTILVQITFRFKMVVQINCQFIMVFKFLLAFKLREGGAGERGPSFSPRRRRIVGKCESHPILSLSPYVHPPASAHTTTIMSITCNVCAYRQTPHI